VDAGNLPPKKRPQFTHGDAIASIVIVENGGMMFIVREPSDATKADRSTLLAQGFRHIDPICLASDRSS
jgi:hypothetical protein